MIPDKVDNCPVCQPILNLLQFLTDAGYLIIEQECRDYHFHELKFIVKDTKSKYNNLSIKIDMIHKHESGIYYCECHWSTILITNPYAYLQNLEADFEMFFTSDLQKSKTIRLTQHKSNEKNQTCKIINISSEVLFKSS